MKRLFLLLLVSIYSVFSYAQDRKSFFPVGTFHSKNVDIYGMSVGFAQHNDQIGKTTTRSYGIRLEPFGDGFSIFFTPKIDFPDFKTFDEYFNRKPIEIAYGLNVSGGTFAFMDVNGITISGGVQVLRKTNGISLSGFGNLSYKINGVQAAIYGTSSYVMRGVVLGILNSEVLDGIGLQVAFFNDYEVFKGLQLGFYNDIQGTGKELYGVQIGLFNSTKKLRGVQIGLWNKNEKRSLPFVNWQFGD